jgi:hypothetical protein
MKVILTTHGETLILYHDPRKIHLTICLHCQGSGIDVICETSDALLTEQEKEVRYRFTDARYFYRKVKLLPALYARYQTMMDCCIRPAK